jgi:hypothetical protein
MDWFPDHSGTIMAQIMGMSSLIRETYSVILITDIYNALLFLYFVFLIN